MSQEMEEELQASSSLKAPDDNDELLWQPQPSANTTSNPRGSGRKPGSKNRQQDPEVLVREQALEALRLVKMGMELSEKALRALGDALVSAGSPKTQNELSESIVAQTEKLARIAAMLIELRKKLFSLPDGGKDTVDDPSTDIKKWLESLN